MVGVITPTGIERYFDASDIIVSKTDLKGRITYANQVFLKIAGYSEAEVVGQPHRIIRHPDMPRAIFKFLWDVVFEGREVFAYVKNMTKCGDHYWVFAHVTPSFDPNGGVAGFHSNRRVPKRSAIEAVDPLYADLLRIEATYKNGKDGLSASFRHLQDVVKSRGSSYEEFVLAL
ncbi:chemotaxis protein [Hyphomicrobium nitrativorans NL23]|uniref:Chemotaxis protein n=1 Tax=Hyphomicrobium nitrativorans NL23 TaxID=1029756 RepID=V5SFE8_9HYPH|nr:PAS domain-containing protein [Hyphomicrobium nitrativorans]AHB49243.1 chemotaxis protein [Hyphomicrobium nitrativorans NL23]